MSLTQTNALVAIAVGTGGFVNQAINATLTATAGATLTFKLQSTSQVQSWVVTIACDDATLNGKVLQWNAGQANQLVLPTPAAPYIMSYQSVVSDGASGIAQVTGQVTSTGTVTPGGGGTLTSSSFVMPAVWTAAAPTVLNIALVSSVGIAIGAGLTLPNLGSFIVTAVPDTTHATILNTGASGNVTPGTTVPNGTPVNIAGSGAPLAAQARLPGQALQLTPGKLDAPVGIRECINLKSYADCTGATDATVGFIAAMAAAVAATLPLYIPGGSTVVISAPLSPPGGLTIEGPEPMFAGGTSKPLIVTRSNGTQWGGFNGYAGPAFMVVPPTIAQPVEYQGPDATTGFYWAKIGGSASSGNFPKLFLSEVPFASLNGLAAFSLEYNINAHTVPINTFFPWVGGGKSLNSPVTSALKVAWNGSGPWDMAVSITTTGGTFSCTTTGAPFALDTDYGLAIEFDGAHLSLKAGVPGSAPTITASVVATGTMLQKPWEDFCLGASQGAGQWPMGFTDQGGQMRWGNLRLSNNARTITTLRGTEFGPADIDTHTSLCISLAPSNRVGVTGLYAACGNPSVFGISATVPTVPVILWRYVLSTGTESGPQVTLRNMAFDTWTDAITADCTIGLKTENLTFSARRAITIVNNSYNSRHKHHTMVTASAGSSHSWGIGLIDVAGLAIIDDVNFGSQCSSTAAIVLYGSSACDIRGLAVNTTNGQWALYVNGGDVLLYNCGAGDEAGTGIQDAFFFFNQTQMVTWVGGGTNNGGGASSSAGIKIDGGCNFRFDVDLATNGASGSALIKAVAAPINPVRLEMSYQGQGLQSAFPWTDGTCPVVVVPLEENGRTVWNAVNSSSITCQWFTSATSAGTHIAQGASGGPTGPDFSCRTIVITDSGANLTGTTVLVMPTNVAGYRRRIVAPSTHAITAWGITIAAGKSAEIESNGTATGERVTADV